MKDSQFARLKQRHLKKWNLTLRAFNKSFQDLYRKVDASAHPMFIDKDILVIRKNDLEPRELRIVGFLWDKFPLPRGNIHVKYSNGQMHNLVKKF
jgi:hypothetical protein